LFITKTPRHDVCDKDYLYEDERFSMKPTAIIEHFDDDGDTTYDRPDRITKIYYDDRGNTSQKRVYADDVNFVLTEYQYHPKYNFPIRQTSWQQYCIETDGVIIKPAASRKVEQLWIYGNADGTPNADGAYLVQQKTLLDSATDNWAVTKYTYYSNGRPKTVENPSTPGKGSYFLCDDKGLVTKVWEGVDITSGEPAASPQKRYFYNGLGRVELQGDSLGQVRSYEYYNIGNIASIKTYDDSTAMTRSDFMTTSYSSRNDFIKLNRYDFYDLHGNCWAERLESGGEIGHHYWHNGKYIMDGTSGYAYPGGAVISAVIYPYPSPDGQMRGTLIGGHGGLGPNYDLIQRDYFYDSMDRVSRKITKAGSNHGNNTYDPPAWLYKVEDFNYYGSGKIRNEKVRNIIIGTGIYESRLEKNIDYFYDSLDRLIKKVEDPNPDPALGLNLTVRYGYDSAGNNTYTVDPLENIIFTDFDQANREKYSYYPKAVVYYPGTTNIDVDSSRADLKLKKKTEYFADSKVKSVIHYDRDGTTILTKSDFTYDDRGRIETVSQDIAQGQAPAVTRYEYRDAGQEFTDSLGNKYHNKITDATNKVTLIALDVYGGTKRTLYPTGHYENIEECLEYTWNGLNDWDVTANEVRKTTGQLGGSSQTIVSKRGDWGEITKVEYPDEGYLEFDYYMVGFEGLRKLWHARDYRTAVDKPTSAPSDTLEYEYEYDLRTGNLDEFIVTENSIVQYTIDYESQVAYPGRKKDVQVILPVLGTFYHVLYDYDKAGRLTDVCDTLMNINQNLIAGFEYDKNGNRSKMKYYRSASRTGDITTINYTYGACSCSCDNMLTSFTTTGGPTFSFDATQPGDIDGLGRLHHCSETITKSNWSQVTHDCTYNYDMLSRLTYAKITDVAPKPYLEYTNTYDNAGNLTDYIYNEGAGDITKTYSFNGDLVTGDNTGKSVNWDENGRQTSQLNTVPADYSLEYDYEGRLRKGLLGNANSRIEAKYTPDGVRVRKKKIVDGVTVYNHKYIVDVFGGVPAILLVLDADNTDLTLKTYIHANGQVLAQHDGDYTAGRLFYLHDRLGSVRQIIDCGGAVWNSYTYDPWGLPVGNETQEAISNLYRYAGYVWDSEISQYHCFRRQYDPVLGRFTTNDPLAGHFEDPMSLHRYLYCSNDSINRRDPRGEAGEWVFRTIEGVSSYYEALNMGLSITIDPADMLIWLPELNDYREYLFSDWRINRPFNWAVYLPTDVQRFFWLMIGDPAAAGEELLSVCDWGGLYGCLRPTLINAGLWKGGQVISCFICGASSGNPIVKAASCGICEALAIVNGKEWLNAVKMINNLNTVRTCMRDNCGKNN